MPHPFLFIPNLIILKLIGEKYRSRSSSLCNSPRIPLPSDCIKIQYILLHHPKEQAHSVSWRIKDQLDVNCYFISLLMCLTCFVHKYIHHHELATYYVKLSHWSYCFCFDVCWSFGVVGLKWYPCCRLQPATRIPLCSHPTRQRPKTATNHIQQNQNNTPNAVTGPLFSWRWA